MNKKRLEGIPHKIALINHSQLIMDAKDYQFLYKQAQRVRELDEQNYAIRESYRQERQYNGKLETENKRYREALEFYADERNYKERDFGIIKQTAIQEGDKGNTARKALEESE